MKIAFKGFNLQKSGFGITRDESFFYIKYSLFQLKIEIMNVNILNHDFGPFKFPNLEKISLDAQFSECLETFSTDFISQSCQNSFRFK